MTQFAIVDVFGLTNNVVETVDVDVNNAYSEVFPLAPRVATCTWESGDNYGDLADLVSESFTHWLYQRIDSTVEDPCEPLEELMDEYKQAVLWSASSGVTLEEMKEGLRNYHIAVLAKEEIDF